MVYRISAPSPEEKEEWMKSIRCAGPARAPRLRVLAVRERARPYACACVRGRARARTHLWEGTHVCTRAHALPRAGPALCPQRRGGSSPLCLERGPASHLRVSSPAPPSPPPERASAGILSMTCWPRGRGGLPIRNRSFLARTGENRSQDSTTTESDWEPPPTPPAPPAPLRSPASSLETARAQWERRPEPRGAFCARRPMSRCPSPGPSPRWRLPAPSREPRASRAALGSPVAAFAVPEAAVL